MGLVVCSLYSACSQVAPATVSLDNLPRFHLTEVFSLGNETDRGDVFFGNIEGRVAVDRAGRILVGESQDPKIYAFTEVGELLAVIGSEGEGPGEFSSLRAVRIGPADTLFAYDNVSDRITAFEPATFNYAYDFTVADDTAGNWPGEFIGAVHSGFLVTFDDPIQPFTDITNEFERARLIDWQGSVVQGLEVVLPGIKFLTVPVRRGFLTTRVPFYRTPVFRVGPDELLYTGTTDSIHIAISAADGTSHGDISVRLEPVAVTGDDINAYLDRYTTYEASQVRSSPLFDVHKTKPAYATFVVDDSYRVWIRHDQSNPDTTLARWILLDAESRPIGDAILPASATLEAVARNRAYTVDEADVETLVVYEIKEP